MNDTPSTDYRVKQMIDSGRSPEGLEYWARDLERELNAANDRIKRLEEDSERLQWLLNRGLAWRDCYDDHWIEELERELNAANAKIKRLEEARMYKMERLAADIIKLHRPDIEAKEAKP